MTSATYALSNPYHGHLSCLIERLHDLCQKPTCAARDDFYSAMSIESLASIPSHTVQLAHHENIRITYGPGATAIFTRLLVGKCDTVKTFTDACKSISDYLEENYSEGISTEPDITHTDIEELISMIEKDGSISDTLSDKHTKIKILLMPAVANADIPGMVYIHTPPTEGPHSCYTIVIPQSMEHASKRTILHILLSELAMCISDQQTRIGIHTCPTTESHTADNHQAYAFPIVYCKQPTSNYDKNMFMLKEAARHHAFILRRMEQALPPLTQGE